MKKDNKDTGRIGEQITEKVLKNKGYSIIKRNFSTRFGEIDLICSKAGITVFVEVKTKKGTYFGTPEEMFTKRKAVRVKRMAIVYLQGKEVSCQIDMVAVVLDDDNNPVRISHYENVVLW